MAEITVLRASASPRNASLNATSAKPHAELSGALPVVNVTMTGNGPQPGNQSKNGVTLLPPKGTNRNAQSARQSVAILPPKATATATEHLTANQLLLCRHLVEAYSGNETVTAENAQLAKATIAAIDAAMVALTTAEAIAAAPAEPRAAAGAPPPRTVVAGSRSSQGHASVTPRRVARPAPPPVIVKMDANQPVVVQMDSSEAPIQSDEIGATD